jgi:hypothetical protein
MNDVNSLFEDFLSAAPNHPPLASLPVGPKLKTPDERRAEWLAQRWGRFTASQFHRLMSNGKLADKLSAGAKAYCLEKAVEIMTEVSVDGYVSPAMQWGLDHEAEAAEAFMARSGLLVDKHNHDQTFLTLGDSIGGTPDGLIKGCAAGVEIKCPSSKVHLDYLGITGAASLFEIAPDYYWQCQGLMLITGYLEWHFVSYDPRFKDEKLRLHTALIKAVVTDIQRLVKRLPLAIQYRDSICASLTHT